MLTAVYIPLNANVGSALGQLHDTISSQQAMYPQVVHIIAGDLKTTLPKFHHHICGVFQVCCYGSKYIGEDVNQHQGQLQGQTATISGPV